MVGQTVSRYRIPEMTGSKTRWLLVGLVWLASWHGAVTYAQHTGWEKHMEAGAKAYEQADYTEARKSFSAALEEASQFGEQNPQREQDGGKDDSTLRSDSNSGAGQLWSSGKDERRHYARRLHG